ncbi:thioredoxin family protein, partial [candidate division KSB1 bacterium]|nr:thioredoxin family protein [candidate division KSB1 bacterium]
PCKMMQPVMKAVEEKFGSQLKVVFYDVWQDNAPARQYGIRVIPTQVFVDESGKEFFRHEGFFAEAEIEKLLVDRGLKVIPKTEPKKK